MKGRVQYSASGLLSVVRSGGMGMEIERWQDLEVPPGSPDCQAALNRLSASVDSLGQKCLNNMESSFSTGGKIYSIRHLPALFWNVAISEK